jgi:hypothetical protein
MRAFLYWFVFSLLVFQTLGYSCPPELFAESWDNKAFEDFANAVHLAEGSSKRAHTIKQMGDLQRSSGKGFAVLDTTDFFPTQTMHRIFNRLPKPSTVVLVSHDVFVAGEILSGKKENQRLSSEELHPFQEYLAWLSQKINQTLPIDEQVLISGADLRVSSAGGKKNLFPEWHQDGGYLAAAVSLLGSGTEYLFESPIGLFEDLTALRLKTQKYGKTPEGQTLLFSGKDRFDNFGDIAPTLHRSPIADTDRMFMIVRYRLKTR